MLRIGVMQAAVSAIESDPTEPVSGLSSEIQTHLGRVLGSTYDRLYANEMDVPGPFKALMERLSAALAVMGERDEKAFHADFLALMPNLQRFALSLTKSHSRADDLVQDTMLRAWRSRTSYTAGTNLSAWLFTIMRNNFYSSCRRASAREVGLSHDDYTVDVPVAPDQQGRLDVQDMTVALSKLSKSMRDALTFVAIDNMTYEEAAVVMKCKIGTVKSRVSRARERLADILGYSNGDFGADHVTLSAMTNAGAAAG